MLTIYVLTYNEEFMLPFFIKHYRSRFPDCKIVVCDNYSTDATVNIALSHGCTVSYYDSGNCLRDDICRDIRNNIWRVPKGIWTSNHVCRTNWCMVVDCDEMVDLTPQHLNEDCNIIKTIGFQMWGENADLENINQGIRCDIYSKVCCWDTTEIKHINYCVGSHYAAPEAKDGYQIKFNTTQVNLYHYKYISLKYTTERNKMIYMRMSEINKEQGWSSHYKDPCEPYYNHLKANKVKVK